MCFSAPASFAASAGLLIVGAVAIKRSKTTPQYFLATIPLLFSVQQFSEGLLWLSLSEAGYGHFKHIAMYVFLVFAQVVWPVFIPLTVLLFEQEPPRKTILRFLLGIGVFISGYLSFCLMFYNVDATIGEHHIRYAVDFPVVNRWFGGIPYLLATVVAPFISSLKLLKALGLVLLISYLVTRILYQHYLVSIWCYFAAVLSLIIVFIIERLRKIPVNE